LGKPLPAKRDDARKIEYGGSGTLNQRRAGKVGPRRVHGLTDEQKESDLFNHASRSGERAKTGRRMRGFAPNVRKKVCVKSQ